jgi:hypothetical protein
VVGGLAVGCDPPVPESPTYEADVRPIFMAHCFRCHGAGGNFNQARAPGPDGGVLNIGKSTLYIDHYQTTTVTCPTPDGGTTTCTHLGALIYGTSSEIGAVIKTDGTTSIPMPPPPAPRLSDWEIKVIEAWIAEKPAPLCSNPPTGDLICPPDAGQ